MKDIAYEINPDKEYFATIIQVADPGLRLDLLRHVGQESLCIKQMVIPGSREIKMTNRGISKTQSETVVFLVDETCIVRLREILNEFDLLEKEITFSYHACPEKILKMLGLRGNG